MATPSGEHKRARAPTEAPADAGADTETKLTRTEAELSSEPYRFFLGSGRKPTDESTYRTILQYAEFIRDAREGKILNEHGARANPVAHEVLVGYAPIKPYGDVEIPGITSEEEWLKRITSTRVAIQTGLRRKYGDDVQYELLRCHRKTGATWKVSFHFVVTNKGHYACARDIDPKSFGIPGLDDQVYCSGVGADDSEKRQTMRAPGSCKEPTYAEEDLEARAVIKAAEEKGKTPTAEELAAEAAAKKRRIATLKAAKAAVIQRDEGEPDPIKFIFDTIKLLDTCTDEMLGAIGGGRQALMRKITGMFIQAIPDGSQLRAPDEGSRSIQDELERTKPGYSKHRRHGRMPPLAELADYIDNIKLPLPRPDGKVQHRRMTAWLCTSVLGAIAKARPSEAKELEQLAHVLYRKHPGYGDGREKAIDQWFQSAEKGQWHSSLIMKYSEYSDPVRHAEICDKYGRAEMPTEFPHFDMPITNRALPLSVFRAWASQNAVYLNAGSYRYAVRGYSVEVAKGKWAYLWEGRTKKDLQEALSGKRVIVVHDDDVLPDPEKKIAPGEVILERAGPRSPWKPKYDSLWDIFSALSFVEDVKHYERIEWRPYSKITPEPSKKFNAFEGFPIAKHTPTRPLPELKESKWWVHLRDYICNARREQPTGSPTNPLFEHLLDRFAWKVQQPEKPWNAMLILHSTGQGTGKDTTVQFLRRLLGASHIASYQKADNFFTERFAPKLMTALIVSLAEIGEKQEIHAHVQELKSRVTEPTQNINKKFVDEVEVPRYWDIIATTNEDSACRVAPGTRRIELYNVDDSRSWLAHADDNDDSLSAEEKASRATARNKAYWNAIYAELDDPDYMKAWYEFLMARPLKGVNPPAKYLTRFAHRCESRNLDLWLQFMVDLARMDRTEDVFTMGNLSQLATAFRSWSIERSGKEYKIDLKEKLDIACANATKPIVVRWRSKTDRSVWLSVSGIVEYVRKLIPTFELTRTEAQEPDTDEKMPDSREILADLDRSQARALRDKMIAAVGQAAFDAMIASVRPPAVDEY
ncbi:MAG: hypothetical protein KGL39_43870 [Patescibacteria group bacterium]|nr:hypothetical protein [Patescibacteria group bacterium]